MNRYLGAAIAVAASCGLLYMEGADVMAQRVPIRTTFNGTDISLMDEEDVTRLLASESEDYVLEITGRGGLVDTITGPEIGLAFDYENDPRELVEEGRNFTWLTNLFSSTRATSSSTLSFSRSALEQAVASLSFFAEGNQIAPVDAAIVADGEGYRIQPENGGSLLDTERTIGAIQAAIQEGRTQLSLQEEGCYVAPAVTSDDPQLLASLEVMNRYADMQLTIPFGESVETLDGSTLSEWFEETTDEAGNAARTLIPEKVTGYASELAAKYNTYGNNRELTTTGGETVTIYGGNYGWILDQKKTAAAITEALQSGQGGMVNPIFSQRAQSFGAHDWGNSYVEIDLDNQHVYVYREGELVIDTDCVTGTALNGHATPDGTYRITFKQQNATLVGEDYRTPVAYWMPFNLGIGLHDATWRSAFGGNLYITGGSHGCVNLPLTAAAAIYEVVDTGWPVLCYGGLNADQAAEFVASGERTSGASTGQESVTSSVQTASVQTPGRTSSASSSSSASPGAGRTASTQTAKPQQQQAQAAQPQPETVIPEGNAIDTGAIAAEQAAIVTQAQANYESLGLTPEEAAAQVQADLQAQFQAQAAQQAAQQAETSQQAQAQAAANAAAQQAAEAQAALLAQQAAEQAAAQYAAQVAAEQAAAAAAAAAQTPAP